MQLPNELLQRIAVLFAQPGYVGPNVKRARDILRALAPLCVTHPALHLKLQPLWRMAHWSLQLARLENPKTPVSEAQAASRAVLGNPYASPTQDATARLEVLLPDEALRQPRLGLLKMAVAQADRAFGHWLIEQLFQDFFVAHSAEAFRLIYNAESPTGALPPLPDLPYRFFSLDLGLNPCLHSRLNLHRRASAIERSFNLLPIIRPHRARLARFDANTLFFIVLNLHLARVEWRSGDKDEVIQLCQRHKTVLGDIPERLHRWCDGFLFLDTATNEIDTALAEKVLNWLIGLPRLDNEAAMRLLAKFCRSAKLRQWASDEALISLLARAMNEIDTRLDDMALLRLHHLFQRFPPELGVAAFKQLSPQRRLSLLRPFYGPRLVPYMEALVCATDIPYDQRSIALEYVIGLVEKDKGKGMQDNALPELRLLREQLI